MSKEIEEKVVEMRFDNKNFEKNVAVSMSTLDKLKEKLNFRGVEKSFDGISSSARGVNLSPISGAVDTVIAKFSSLDIIGVTALQNITNKAINAGEQLVKSLTVDQIGAGWGKYEDETKAVQTIVNATGKSIEDVEAQLARLSWFTDETSYSYIDMVSNVGKFTSMNIPLNDAVTAMEGIANWAAVSGQGINEASRAMYNLSQAMGVGAVKLQDWKSIENANMATAEFKQTAIDTAKSMGLLTKAGKTVKGNMVDLANFSQTLTDEWFTKDVLMATLKKYGAYSDKVYDFMQKTEDAGLTCAEAMDLVSSKGMELGAKAFKAGQEAKTLTEAIDSVKDAVSTGWKDTFKIIFGNYEQAKVLWTDLANELWEIFASGSERRNEIFEQWAGNLDGQLGGRDDVIGAMKNALEGLKQVLDIVKTAFENVFPPITAETLKKFSTNLKKFSEKLILSEEKADKLQRTLQGLFAILDIVRIVITDAVQIGLTIFNTLLGKSTDKIGDMTANMGDSIVSFRDWIKEHDHSVESIKKICDKIATVRDAIKKWIDDHVHLRESLSKLREHIQNGTEKIGAFAKKIWELPAVQTAITKTKDALAKFFDKAKEYFSEGYDRIKEFIDHLKTLDGFSFDNIKDAAKSFKEIVLDHFFNIEGAVDKLKSVFNSLKDSITNSFSKAGDSMDTFRDKITGFGKLVKDKAEAATDFSYKWGTTSNNLKTYALQAKKRLKEVVDVGDLLSIALGGTLILSIKNISDAFKTLNGFLKTFTSPIDALTKVFQGLEKITNAYAKKISVDAMTKMIKGIAIAIAILVGVVFVLSKLAEKGTMWEAIEGLLAIAGIMVATVAAMAAINKLLGSMKIDAGIQASILAIAISIAILVKAMKSIGEIDDVFTAVVAIAALGAALVLLTAFMSKLVDVSDEKGLISGALTVIAISVAIYILVAALKKLSTIHFDSIGESLSALGLAIAGMAVLMLSARGISIGGAIALIAAVIALQRLVNLLKKTTDEDMDKILANLVKFIPIFLVFSRLMVASKSAGKNAAKAGIAILLMSVSLLLVLQAIKMISKMSGSELAKGILVVSLILAAFGALMALSKYSGKNAAKAGVMILLMSGALLIVAGAVKIFSSMSASELAKGVTAVVVLGLLMGAIIAMSKKSKDAKNTLIGMSIAIAVMSVSLIALSFIEWNRLLPAAAALSAVVLSLAAALSATKKIDKKAKSTILIFALVIAEIAAALFFLADKPWSSLLAAAGGLSLVLLALSASFLILSKAKKLKKGVVRQLYAMAGIIVILGGILLAMQRFSGGNMSSAISAASGIGILLSVLSGAFFVLSKAKKLKKDVIGQLYAMAGIMAILGVILLIMQRFSGGNMSSAILSAISISILLSALTGAFYVLGTMKINLQKGVIGQLYAMAGIMAILGVILLIMQRFSGGNMDTAIKSALAISILLTVLVGATLLFSLMKPVPNTALVSLAVMVGVLGLIALILGLMTGLNVAPAIETVLALSIMLIALVAATGLMSLIPPIPPIALVSLLGMVVALGLVALILGLMAKFDVAPSIETALALSILLFALVLACIPLALIGALGVAVIAGAAVFDAVIAIIGALLVGIGALMEYVPEAEEFLDKGIVILEKVGTGIGTFFGNMISSFGERVAASLPKIAMSLSLFMMGLQPFFIGAKQASDTALDGVKKLVEIILLISAASVIDGIARWLTGGSSMSTFVDSLNELAPALKKYSDEITKDGGIDADAVEASANAAKVIVEMANMIPRTGGLLQDLIGVKDLTKFAKDLKEFAPAIREYSDAITKDGGIDPDAIKASANAAKTLAELVNALPSTGGKWQELVGVKDLTKFAKDLKEFAPAIKEYSDAITKDGGLKPQAIKDSATAAKTLAELNNALPSRDGMLQKWIGTKDTLENFGDNIVIFGGSLKAYSDTITDGDGISKDAIDASKNAAESLVELNDALPNSGGVWQWFTGENDLGTFGSQIEAFGNSMKIYADSIKDIKPESVTASANAARMLAATAAVVEDNDIDKNTFDGFGKAITTLSDKIKDFYTSMQDVDSTKLVTSISKVNKIVEMGKGIKGIDADLMKKFSDSLKKMAKDGADEFYTSMQDVDSTKLDTAISNVKKLVEMAKGITGIDTDSMKKFGESLKKMAKDGVDGFVKAFSDAKSRIETSAKSVLSNFITGLDAKKGDVDEDFSGIVSSAITAITSKYDDFQNSGKYIVDGLAKGISANESVVEIAAEKAAAAALNSAKERLKEQSPSREFYKVGYYAVLGMANAMTDGRSTAYDAGYGMADNAVSGLKKAIVGISDMIEDNVDMQPTIRPVMDLSDIQNGTNRMNRMFGDRYVNLSTETANALSSDISAEMNARTLVKENELLGKISDLLEDMDSRIGNEEETVPFVMNIENFNNNTDQDIEQLTDELSVRLATKINRKKATFR